MKPFARLLDHAEAHHGRATVAARLPAVESPETLAALPDDRYLSDMSRRVFRAGLKHSLVDAKWPAFERAFFGFDPVKISLMSDEQLEALMGDTSLIRHWGKLKAVRHNAVMVRELGQDKGGFGVFIADWPVTEIVDLWLLLKRRGAQLGGQSGAAFLRMVGKDTFRLTPDVVAALKAQGVVEKAPGARRDLLRTQAAFNHWHDESGWPLSHISQVLALTVGW